MAYWSSEDLIIPSSHNQLVSWARLQAASLRAALQCGGPKADSRAPRFGGQTRASDSFHPNTVDGTESKALTQPLDLPLAQTETKTDPPDLQHFTRAHLAKPRCTAARPGAKPWLGLSNTLASSASAAPGAGLRSRAVRPSLAGNTSSPLCSTTGCSSPSLLLNERAR